jgi:hypothetical protein
MAETTAEPAAWPVQQQQQQQSQQALQPRALTWMTILFMVSVPVLSEQSMFMPAISSIAYT